MPLSEVQGDAALTADRAERKYLVEPGRVLGLARALERELQRHRYTGDGANVLPRAQHFTTTIYFDTADGAILRDAERGVPHTKLRAREYYDLHPDLTELAQSSSELVRYSPLLWLELKAREGDQSRKQRVGIPKPEVPRFFASGEASAEMRAIAHGGAAEEALGELQRFRAGFASPLEACVLVNYRRNAWQDPEGTVRVTLDRDLSVFAPLPDMWTAERALSREALGTVRYEEPCCILELKHRGPAPGWIDRTLADAGAEQCNYSKFVQACRRLRA
ncbi:MAG: VTC domain-containing protein [Myxococcales bacterium]|nr:VTC domain-containing protein [Myxococcales bacterium]